jgi:hypothetical protein
MMATKYTLYAKYNYGTYEPAAGTNRIDAADEIAQSKLEQEPEIDYIDIVDAGGKHMFQYSRSGNGTIRRQIYA